MIVASRAGLGLNSIKFNYEKYFLIQELLIVPKFLGLQRKSPAGQKRIAAGTSPKGYCRAIIKAKHGAGKTALKTLKGEKKMEIREYRPGDCEELTRLFYDTVHTVNCKDYTAAQLDAWADGKPDLERWDRSLQEHFSLVALEGEQIVGFGDMDSTGYLDRLYVHKDHQGRGIATALCDRLEQTAAGTIITHASITARPFFEGRGYVVVKEQQVERKGILLRNFVMEKRR